MFLLFLVLTLILILILTYLVFQKSYKTWSNLKVPYLPPTFPFGNFGATTKNIHFGIVCQQLYEKLKGQGQYAGVYLFKQPNLLATHPDFVKKVLLEDFDTFNDRGLHFNAKHDPMAMNIFFLEGAEWRSLKQKLIPAFSSNKMRMVCGTVADVGKKLTEHIDTAKLYGTSEIDIRKLIAGYTADVISSCVFGADLDSIGNPDSEFLKAEQKLMNYSKWRNLLTFWATMFPETAGKLGYRLFDKNSTEFFVEMVHKTIGFRKENNFHRNDIMQTMIDLMSHNDEHGSGLSVDEIAANALIFLYSGFESSSITITYALYQLALNKEIQDQVRYEIENTLEQFEGRVNYDSIGKMDILERVILETLRMHPPVSTIHRVAKNAYTLPNGSKIVKGTHLIVPVYGFHYDSTVFPKPNSFDPDRFTKENVAKRLPYSYIPFGEGPRICIGERFAMMVVKIGLISVLRKCKVDVCSKTEIPIKVDNTSLVLVPKGGVYLKLNKEPTVS